MKYRFIEQESASHSVTRMCEVLKQSRSGYYAWKKREPGIRHRENEGLLSRIREIHEQSRRLYGSPGSGRSL